ncbi:MAG TPA: PhoPQ-activated pathogenicity-related family protein [Verrucomicrobiota bacterium]|nr:PhoPQ-activated pathogenicity-related family protein [Verrucomicrobiota bacterium]
MGLSVALLGADLLSARAEPRSVPAAEQTALDRYVAQPDPSYSWKMAMSMRDESATGYALDLISQTWRTTNEVNQPTWRHWLLVVKPDNLAHTTGLLFISGGNNKASKPPTPTRELIRIAKDTRCVVAELKMVPNQPLIFGGDGQERTEDDLIGYTWDKFLRTGDETWPARLPMTKAAVRAMDAVTEFLASEAGGKATVDTFVVAGGSKRGWTTWTTAAVDRRVVAICPIVIDVLNVTKSMDHHYRAYGFYAPAVGNYSEQHRIMDWLGTPEMEVLNKIEDPFSYRERFTIPKLLLNAAGDQFFLPDSSQFYFNELPAPKYLRYVANTDHSMRGSDAYETLLAWQYAIANQVPLPRFTWQHEPDGTLKITTQDVPKEVVLWTGYNSGVRDFRMEVAGSVYKSVPLAPVEPGTYVASVPKPAEGWTAYFAELTYDVGAVTPLKLTTDVRVTPDELPFDGPHPKSPKGFLQK